MPQRIINICECCRKSREELVLYDVYGKLSRGEDKINIIVTDICDVCLKKVRDFIEEMKRDG